jgi:hypothetical protein
MAYTTIDLPSEYFNTKLYTGNLSTNNITGVGFQPDLVWLKSRVQGTTGYNGNNYLFDAVRGATNWIISNQTGAEANNASSLSSFDSDGFTLGALDFINNNGDGFASWNWLANGAGSANTDGTISSTVSANTTSGFSIVSYTSNGSASQTVGHGLGVAPNVIISKNRTDGGATYGNWVVYHSSLATANDTKILLNSTAASSSTNEWGDTDPTSTVYSVHTSGDGATNHSSDNIVSYCFAEKKGFSKFGSYTGNGSTDGTFVYLGFKPAFVMTKRTNTTGNWQMHDAVRDIDNEVEKRLYPNVNNAELTSDFADFTANGFKLRNTGSDTNASGSTYIYMAFAENPFVTSTGIPTTAR